MTVLTHVHQIVMNVLQLQFVQLVQPAMSLNQIFALTNVMMPTVLIVELIRQLVQLVSLDIIQMLTHVKNAQMDVKVVQLEMIVILVTGMDFSPKLIILKILVRVVRKGVKFVLTQNVFHAKKDINSKMVSVRKKEYCFGLLVEF